MQHLKEIKSAIQRIAPFSDDYQALLERIVSLSIELDDIGEELSKSSEKLINDPEKLALYNQKLQLIYTLQKKHQVDSDSNQHYSR